MATNTERFLDAYARTERYLRKTTGNYHGLPYGQLVREAARRDRVVRRFRDDLLEFAELRNAIVHQRVDGHPIAEPYERTAIDLEHIADLMDRPPRLGGPFVKSVSIGDAAEPVAKALHRMREGDHSVLPIYERGAFVGLLTASGITNWLASNLVGAADIGRQSVRDVLAFVKKPEDRVLFASRELTALDALDSFQQAYEKGRKLDAILITEGGHRDGRVLGLVTVADIPSLLELVE